MTIGERVKISIHALREEGDLARLGFAAEDRISIHALREEGDPGAAQERGDPADFNPRPPRGGRPMRRCCSSRRLQISIHALREEGDHHSPSITARTCPISIHALREEGDRQTRSIQSERRYFNPRPPRGGRQRCRPQHKDLLYISIHALREEGDLKCTFADAYAK